MNHSRKAAAVGLLLATCLCAQDLNVDIPYQKFVLPNGLTLLVHEDRKAPIVAVNVWYHVGSKNESHGRTGFAHLFEHLMFNGTEHFNQDYFKVLEKLGATDLNGTTNEDRTNYFQNVPTSALDTVLWMESDRMGHLVGVIDKPRLDEQRGVVQNEKRQGENEPYGMIEILLPESAFPAGHPYSWSVIGSMDDLNAASLEDVKDWFQTLLRPVERDHRARGRHRREDGERESREVLRRYPAGPPLAKPDAVDRQAHRHQRRVVLQDRVPQARIYKVWNVPAGGTAEADQLQPVRRDSRPRQVLPSLQAARLRGSDRDRRNGVARWRARSPSLFMIQATARPGGDLTAVEKALQEELSDLLANGPTAEEVKRAQDAVPSPTSCAASSASAASAANPTSWPRARSTRATPSTTRPSSRPSRRPPPPTSNGSPRAWLSDGAARHRGPSLPQVHQRLAGRRSEQGARARSGQRCEVPEARARHPVQWTEDHSRANAMPSRS